MNVTEVNLSHFEQAIDRVICGLEKKNKVGQARFGCLASAAPLGVPIAAAPAGVLPAVILVKPVINPEMLLNPESDIQG